MRNVKVHHYLERATDYFEGMGLLRSDAAYKSSSALLAIHSAIAYSDALRTGLSNESLGADDHTAAANELQKLVLSVAPNSRNGLAHFRYLLSKKHFVTYSDRRLEHSDLEALLTRAERLAKWVKDLGSELKIEGWPSHDQ